MRNGSVIERVDAVPDIKLEGCILNCWSGRVKYKGGLTKVPFSIIIQVCRKHVVVCVSVCVRAKVCVRERG